MALQTVATMTADELLVMPHNGYRYELIKGELRQTRQSLQRCDR